VRRCLAKDPEKRYQSIKDVAIDLEDLQQELRGKTPERPASNESRRHVSVGDRSATAAVSTAEVSARQTSSAEYLVARWEGDGRRTVNNWRLRAAARSVMSC
jgi:hypothetical protein